MGIPEYFRVNTIYCGDCQDVLSRFPDNYVDLIYADPPFFSNKRYEIVWKDGYEIRALEDRWKGGIENYIAWMEPKLRECHRVLNKTTGSMYLHCNWHAAHYLKVAMDRIFARSQFRNEIIWQRGPTEIPQRLLARVHDTLLWYSKSNDYFWEPVRVPYSPSLLKSLKKDEKGWYYTRGRKHRKMAQWEIEAGRGLKSYVDPNKGKIASDIWDDVGSYNLGPEKLGYPTQKPETLLDRIIRSSSKHDGRVLDPFCGCGTAIAVAHKLGREWIGVDISPTACKVMVRRMQTLGVPVNEADVIGLPRTIEELKIMEPFEFQNWVLQRLGGRVNQRKVGDMGIDGWLGDKPVQVKRWGHSVGRVEIDKFETAMRREKKKEGIVVGFEFGRQAHEEVARVKNADGEERLHITLVTVKELVGADEARVAPALH